MYEEPTNARRADWAEAAADSFAVLTFGGVGYRSHGHDDRYDIIKDLVTDLLHLARREGFDPAGVMGGAQMCFEDEEAEERPALVNKVLEVRKAHQARED